MKLTGTPAPGVQLSPDGKKVLQEKKRYDVSKELQLKKNPKVKVRAVQDYRP